MTKEGEIKILESDFIRAIETRMTDSKYATSRKEIRRCLTNAIKTIERENRFVKCVEGVA